MKSFKLSLLSLVFLLSNLSGGLANAEMQSSNSVDLPSCWCESCHAMVQCTNLEASNRSAPPTSSSKPSSAGAATEASQ